MISPWLNLTNFFSQEQKAQKGWPVHWFAAAKVFVEFMPSSLSMRACLVAAQDYHKATLEAFIGFIFPVLTWDMPSGSISVTWISVANVKPAESEAISVTCTDNNGRVTWTTFWRFWLQKQFWSYQIETQDARASQFCQEFLRWVCFYWRLLSKCKEKKDSLSRSHSLYRRCHYGVVESQISPVFKELLGCP